MNRLADSNDKPPFFISVNADRQEQADEWNKATRPQITVNGQIVTVDANTQGARYRRISSDLDIAVPRKAGSITS